MHPSLGVSHCSGKHWTVGLARYLNFWITHARYTSAGVRHFFSRVREGEEILRVHHKGYAGTESSYQQLQGCDDLDVWEPPQMDDAFGCYAYITSYDSTAIMPWHLVDPKWRQICFSNVSGGFVKGPQQAHLPVENCVKTTKRLVIFSSGCPETKC